MTDAIVNISLSGESDALHHFFLFLIDFVSLLHDHVVSNFTKLESWDAHLSSINEFSQNTEIKLINASNYTSYLTHQRGENLSRLRRFPNDLNVLKTHRLAISPAILYFVTTRSLAIVHSVSDSESDMIYPICIRIWIKKNIKKNQNKWN